MHFTCYIILGLVSAAYAVPLSTVYNNMEGASDQRSLSFQARGSLPYGKLISRTEETEPILAKQVSHTSSNSDANDDHEPIDANNPRPEVSEAKHLTLGFVGESNPGTQKNGMSPDAAGPSQTKSTRFGLRTKLEALKNRIAKSSLMRPEDRSKFILHDVGKDPISKGKGGTSH
ncbi:MAG: hypothetical protein NXY57DRAFT_980319 [Lentinula lateritia]|uniref:Uncharacterized protein n=1 Tax=Lentinula lateritia TaxID=40482 RepID=A0ABQ8VVZ6_9AGAR|nr:MAG: hypothetical protein NXY57DRAFT_980319 [Lentinula lateritia]KAJ4500533.1 hypothetical protein C8R41DRAFT_863121 [Lentinula lateritia]